MTNLAAAVELCSHGIPLFGGRCIQCEIVWEIQSIAWHEKALERSRAKLKELEKLDV